MKNMERGAWLCHAAGAAKISIISQSFYGSCLSRLLQKGGVFASYLPWMASPQIAMFESEQGCRRDAVYAENTLDFSPDFLKYMNSYLELAMSQEWMRRADHIRIFHEIELFPNSIEVYKDALKYTQYWPSWQKYVFTLVVKSIIPLCANEDLPYENGHSFSDHHFIGAIFTSIDTTSPYPELSLNLTFSHELAHQVLMFYQHSGNLLDNTDELVYSGIRKTLRPAISALHAACALGYMIETCKALIDRENDVCRKAFLKSKQEEYLCSLNLGLEALSLLKKSNLCSDLIEDLYRILAMR